MRRCGLMSSAASIDITIGATNVRFWCKSGSKYLKQIAAKRSPLVVETSLNVH